MAAPVCVARIGAAHGVRGAVKLWTFTEDPLAVQSYGPLMTKDGARQFEIANLRAAKDHLVDGQVVRTQKPVDHLGGHVVGAQAGQGAAVAADRAALATAEKDVGHARDSR